MSIDTHELAVHRPSDELVSYEELRLANRNRGMPLEMMAYDLTPDGLHYLLIHFDIPVIDEAKWSLRIGGAVQRQIGLDLDAIRRRPARTLPVTLECAGNGRGLLRPRPVSMPWLGEAIGTAEWTGTPLAPILEEAGIGDDAVEVVFWGADRGVQGEEEHDYARSLRLEEALRPDVLLAYEMNGRPLAPQHGYPLRLLVPGWYGMTSVKWLKSIEVVTEPFTGYQQAVAYRYQRDEDDPGEPVDRIRVRAMMIPPGIPDFLTRRRHLPPGPVEIRGRAWSGQGPVEKVEFGVDGSWLEARLDQPLGEYAWRGWRVEWEATVGDHELTCRATDETGATQPLETVWNWQGMGNNAVQRVAVTVA